jgi:putative hydrolase of the HAD superfamily
LIDVKRPAGVLLDFGGTLVEEVAYEPRPGTAALLARAVHIPPGVTLDVAVARARRVSAAVSKRRDEFQIEVPWPAVTRLIHDFLGVRFAASWPELELHFWEASVTMRPMPGAAEALAAMAEAGIPMAVVSNSSFGAATVQHELAKHGLADHLAFVMVSADYGVRKPNPLLFDTAAARLGVPGNRVWFVGDRLDTDIAGARAAGLRTVWLHPTGAGESAGPDSTVKSWAEFVDLFQEATWQ